LAGKIQSVLSDYEADIPTDSAFHWIILSPSKIQRKIRAVGQEVSYYLIANLIKDLGCRNRQYSKEQSLSNPENRDAQFNKIATLKKAFFQSGLLVLSIDTKQKEMLGNIGKTTCNGFIPMQIAC
jgi:hypothetical protein